MLSLLPRPIVGTLALILFIINILVLSFAVIFFGLIKFLLPLHFWKEFCTTMQNDILPSVWIDINNSILRLVANIKWEIHGKGELHRDHWYFVIANHRSWSDIVVIQKIFNRKIPILKFFLKQELLWILPLGGLACWMLGFPFMKRYSKNKLKKNPELKNTDFERTKKGCDLFKLRPTTVMNFLEGTRFTTEKQQQRSSPYANLLRPKSGGLAFVISELRNYIREIVDVTIIYDHADPSFWNFISGRITKIIICYEVVPIPEELYGDYYNDTLFRRNFQTWLNQRWQEKDKLISSILKKETMP